MRTPQRTFVGQRPAGPARESGLSALADVFLGGEGTARRAVLPGREKPGSADPPRGVYALVPAGIEPSERRRVGLAVARRLAPASRPSAVFVFGQGRADAHLVGEPACGRVGPNNYLHASDLARVVSDLVGQSDQVGIVLLEPANGRPADLARAIRRAVFVGAPDAESLVETYRGVKSWRQKDGGTPVSLFVVGSADEQEAAAVRRRLSGATREFLGCEVGDQGFMNGGAGGGALEPLNVVTQAPAEEVWRLLLAAVGAAPMVTHEVAASETSSAASPGPPAVAPARLPEREPTPAECPAFSFWEPEERGALLAAIEAQVPALLGEGLRLVFRVDVDEAAAPPLAAVREDGALVAIVVAEAGRPVDTRAVERWVEVHRSLLGRAYPSAGICDRPPSVIILAPLAPPGVGDGIRRFVPVRTGGRHGIVLLP